MRITGVSPKDLGIYKPVFQHRSLFPGADENYERLEFLGDAILNSIISELLYYQYPGENEGFLTELRAKIVNRKQLNEIGEQLGLRDVVISPGSRSAPLVLLQAALKTFRFMN